MKKVNKPSFIDKQTFAGIKALVVETSAERHARENAERAARTEKKRAEMAAAAAEEKAQRVAAFKAECKTYQYLIVGENVYKFPKTLVHPDRFTSGLVKLGQDPNEYKLSAVKPRNSNPIEVFDLRIAVRRGNAAAMLNVQRTRIETVENPAAKMGYTLQPLAKTRRLAWPLQSSLTEAQFLSTIHPNVLGIFCD